MSFNNSVVALLAIAVVLTLSQSFVVSHRQCAHSSQLEVMRAPYRHAGEEVRVSRIAKHALVDAMESTNNRLVASLLGLESHSRLPHAELASLASGEAPYAVVRVRDRGQIATMVVLVE